MRRRQKVAVLLTVLLFLVNTPLTNVPAAESRETEAIMIDSSSTEAILQEEINISDSTEMRESPTEQEEMPSGPPEFQAEFVEAGDYPGIYGTLSSVPADATDITVEYSMDGKQYHSAKVGENYENEWGIRSWNLEGTSGENGTEVKYTQLCMGMYDAPFIAYQNEDINTLYIRLQIVRESGELFTQPVRYSHEKTWPTPQEAPAFEAELVSWGGAFQVVGHFSDFLPDVTGITTWYSLDGENYSPIESSDWDMAVNYIDGVISRDMKQCCVFTNSEPLVSFLAEKLDHFYLKLELTKENGETYYTEQSEINREKQQQVPENSAVMAVFPSTMRISTGRPPNLVTYGSYHLTVREGASPEEVQKLLPDTLPIEVQIYLKNEAVPAVGIVQCPVKWKSLSPMQFTEGKTQIIPDAAEELAVPAGTEINTPYGRYLLQKQLAFDPSVSNDEVRLTLNVIGADVKANATLKGDEPSTGETDSLPLVLSFPLKPSGATSILVSTYAEGGESWIPVCDVLSLKEVDANQSAPQYGDMNILQPDNVTYRAYLNGDIPGFIIGLKIKGGVYDGEEVILPWPGKYNAPPRIPELGSGSGGNENNAGSSDGNESNHSSGSGGQRPGISPNPVQPELPTDQTKPDNPPAVPSTAPDISEPSGGGNGSENLILPIAPKFKKQPAVTDNLKTFISHFLTAQDLPYLTIPSAGGTISADQTITPQGDSAAQQLQSNINRPPFLESAKTGLDAVPKESPQILISSAINKNTGQSKRFPPQAKAAILTAGTTAVFGIAIKFMCGKSITSVGVFLKLKALLRILLHKL